MPFIDSKITVSLTPKKEEAIKTKLGEAIQILNKSETYLMVGFEDNYDLYMGGSKLSICFCQSVWSGISVCLFRNDKSYLRHFK